LGETKRYHERAGVSKKKVNKREVNKRGQQKGYHERAGVSKKSTLESFAKPKFVPFSLETPECYTSVSTNTSGN
jgi:hypothetical protein